MVITKHGKKAELDSKVVIYYFSLIFAPDLCLLLSRFKVSHVSILGSRILALFGIEILV